MKLLPIPTCQHIVLGQRIALGAYDGGGPRLCGRVSVAVLRYDDGQERFVCDEHQEAEAQPGAPWRLHRREVAAGPVSRAAVARRVVPQGPKRFVSAEARARMAAGQRARWARIRQQGEPLERRSA